MALTPSAQGNGSIVGDLAVRAAPAGPGADVTYTVPYSAERTKEAVPTTKWLTLVVVTGLGLALGALPLLITRARMARIRVRDAHGPLQVTRQRFSVVDGRVSGLDIRSQDLRPVHSGTAETVRRLDLDQVSVVPQALGNPFTVPDCGVTRQGGPVVTSRSTAADGTPPRLPLVLTGQWVAWPVGPDEFEALVFLSSAEVLDSLLPSTNQNVTERIESSAALLTATGQGKAPATVPDGAAAPADAADQGAGSEWREPGQAPGWGDQRPGGGTDSGPGSVGLLRLGRRAARGATRPEPVVSSAQEPVRRERREKEQLMAGTVRPVLFVGCGGSGGVTLRFTMDALRAEVRRWNDARIATDGERARVDFTGTQGLPRSWQFLHIDVPATPDGNAADRPPSVPEQGGSYVSVAPTGFAYRTVSDQLWAKSSGKPTRHLLTGWMKAPNPATDPVLTAGAGQMRNVGRAVTLYSLAKIGDGLDSAGQQLVSAGAREDLRKLAALVSAEVTDEPAVFIVSSMSGGAGASMVLDVARVLTRMRPTWQGLTSMFLYTSEVFSDLPEVARTGVEGNGLATLGELLATSLGANGQRVAHTGDSPAQREATRLEALHDENRLLSDLGFGAGGDAESQTFKRVFPIGRTQGPNAALFGNGSMDVIYRAIGRGLAGLVASPTALSDFTSYDLVNNNFIHTDLEWLGSGGPAEQSVLWGSFGFGRLSLGRDRYGEYLAQRVAREAVDRLSGAAGPARATAERDTAVAADAAHASLLLNLGLPGVPQQVNLQALLGRSTTREQARADVLAPIRQLLTERLYKHPQVAIATNSLDFPLALARVGTDIARPLMAEINDIGYRTVYRWVDRFVADLLRAVEDVGARQGLPVARQVVLRLKDDAALWSRALVSEGRANAPEGGTLLPPPPPAGLDAIRKLPTLGPDHPVREQLLNEHVGLVARGCGRADGDRPGRGARGVRRPRRPSPCPCAAGADHPGRRRAAPHPGGRRRRRGADRRLRRMAHRDGHRADPFPRCPQRGHAHRPRLVRPAGRRRSGGDPGGPRPGHPGGGARGHAAGDPHGPLDRPPRRHLDRAHHRDHLRMGPVVDGPGPAAAGPGKGRDARSVRDPGLTRSRSSPVLAAGCSGRAGSSRPSSARGSAGTSRTPRDDRTSSAAPSSRGSSA